MNWYLAKIIYQVISGDGLHTPQFDEQFRLIKADELEWAWEKAQVVGRMGESSGNGADYLFFVAFFSFAICCAFNHDSS